MEPPTAMEKAGAEPRGEATRTGLSGLRRFLSVIDQYFALGGMQIQFNVVSRETLIDAQEHPEKYSDLIVRVAGYSAYFTQLSRDVQQDIIERTEQRL